MRFSTLAVAAGVLALPLAARADLVGDTIQVQAAYPTSSAITTNIGSYMITSGGSASGNYSTFATFVINADQIFITDDTAVTVPSAAFTGLEFTDLTNSDIASVTIDGTSSPDLSGAAVSVAGSNEVLVNLEGLSATPYDTLVLDLNFTPPASVTPEPASIALLGTGLLGVAGTMRRRFMRS